MAIACGDVAVGWPRGQPPPIAEVSDEIGRGPARGSHPGGGAPGALGPCLGEGYGGPRAALRSSGRVWLSQTASSLSHLRHPCAGLPPLALREELFRALRTPHARKAARGSRRIALPYRSCPKHRRLRRCQTTLLTAIPVNGGSHGDRTPLGTPLYPLQGPPGPPLARDPPRPKKCPQTVPTGRVIKYPKKCALFAPPPGAPRAWPPGGRSRPWRASSGATRAVSQLRYSGVT